MDQTLNSLNFVFLMTAFKPGNEFVQPNDEDKTDISKKRASQANVFEA